MFTEANQQFAREMLVKCVSKSCGINVSNISAGHLCECVYIICTLEEGWGLFTESAKQKQWTAVEC